MNSINTPENTSSTQQVSDEHDEFIVVSNNDKVIVEAPNYMKFERTPFDFRTFEEIFSCLDHTDYDTQVDIKHMIEDTVRWRVSKDAAGNEICESNTKLVKWSDGTVSLHIGSKMFAVEKEKKDETTKIVIKPFVPSSKASEDDESKESMDEKRKTDLPQSTINPNYQLDVFNPDAGNVQKPILGYHSTNNDENTRESIYTAVEHKEHSPVYIDFTEEVSRSGYESEKDKSNQEEPVMDEQAETNYAKEANKSYEDQQEHSLVCQNDVFQKPLEPGTNERDSLSAAANNQDVQSAENGDESKRTDPTHSAASQRESSSEPIGKEETQQSQPQTRYHLRTRRTKRIHPDYTTSSDEASVSNTKKRATRKASSASVDEKIGKAKKERLNKKTSLSPLLEIHGQKSTYFKKYRNTRANDAGSDSESSHQTTSTIHNFFEEEA